MRCRIDDQVLSEPKSSCSTCHGMAEEMKFLREQIEKAIQHIHNGKHRSAVAILHDTRKNRDYKERS